MEKKMEEQNMPRMTVAGIGGVGGLLAGQLIRTYGEKVSLLARGERKRHLESEGLTLESDLFGQFTVHPAVVTEDLAALSEQDVILVCVKNGDLPSLFPQLRAAVSEKTIVVPVMNGITAGEALREALPKGLVCDSVIYTVSGAGADYHIRQSGDFTNLFIGSMNHVPEEQEAARLVGRLLEEAGITCVVKESVKEEIWKKYILNCAFNIVTAARSATIGEIRENETWTKEYRALLEEAWQVSRAEGVDLSEDIVEEFFQRLYTYTPDSVSSLSRDFAAGREGEMRIFSEEVARRAARHNLPVPVTEQYARLLRETIAAKKQQA